MRNKIYPSPLADVPPYTTDKQQSALNWGGLLGIILSTAIWAGGAVLIAQPPMRLAEIIPAALVGIITMVVCVVPVATLIAKRS